MAGSTIEDATGRITKKLRVDLHENCQGLVQDRSDYIWRLSRSEYRHFFFFKGLLIILRGYH